MLDVDAVTAGDADDDTDVFIGVPTLHIVGKTDSPQEIQDLAAIAMSKLHTADATRLTEIDPLLLWGLAEIIGMIMSACAQAHMKTKLQRVARRPHSLHHAIMTRQLANRLPSRFGDDREALAGAMIATGMEVVDDTERWNAAFAAFAR